MCELMAMSFGDPIPADFSIREFAARGEENPDGWGVAWYPDQSLALVKEPVKWSESRLARFLETDDRQPSRIHLAHVRHKTVGDQPRHADTHPFARVLAGREYVFAHNGTLGGLLWDLPIGSHQPLGQTDSERFFCHLLHEIDRRGSTLEREADWLWLHQKLALANKMGKLNALVSDGRRLFVYHDENAWKGLNFRKLHFLPGQPRGFHDPTIADDQDGPVANHGFVVATCPLSRSGWHSFQVGELIVFEQGSIRFSSHRDYRSPEFSPEIEPQEAISWRATSGQ